MSTWGHFQKEFCPKACPIGAIKSLYHEAGHGIYCPRVEAKDPWEKDYILNILGSRNEPLYCD